jgi:aryl sulfotransferase
MTEATTTDPDVAPLEGPPPWIDTTIQQRIQWRDGDIVISVPAKSGTTWTMNIVHQLRSGGDGGFVDVYAEVPWLELVPSPDAELDDLVAGFDRMGDDRRRAFKTHSAPGTLPYFGPDERPEVSYVVVMRNPDEAIASMRPFLAAHSDEWFDLWEVPKAEVVGPDLPAFLDGIGQGLLFGLFAFLAEWWPLRHNANVEFVHFADLKRDPDTEVRRIADFLEFDIAEDAWPRILEHTSFAWMKANESKFELCSVAEVPPLLPGAMVRKGQVGAAAEDGVTAEMSAAIAELGRAVVDDEAALAWLYRGGPLAG